MENSIIREPHPLARWLDEQGLKPYEFADRAGMNRGTVYKVLKGVNSSGDTYIAIEAATDSAVTVRAMMTWREKYTKQEKDL